MKYHDSSSAITAIHLTGIELGDRVLLVTPFVRQPASDQTLTSSTISNAAKLALTPSIPAPLSAPLSALSQASTISALHIDQAKADEIARTVYVGNVATPITEADLTQFFSDCGPIVLVRIAGDPTKETRFAFVEFKSAESANRAVNYKSGQVIFNRAIKYVLLFLTPSIISARQHIVHLEYRTQRMQSTRRLQQRAGATRPARNIWVRHWTRCARPRCKLRVSMVWR